MSGAVLLLALSALSPTADDTTFVVPPGARIVVEHRDGEIDVMGVRGREARVLMDGEARAALAYESGGVIHVGQSRRWDDGGDLSLWVPHDVDVAVHGLDGDVRIIDVSGDVSVETADGDVEVDGARSVRIASVDGDVELFDIDGDADVHIGDGDAWLRDVRGAVEVNGVDGDLVVIDGDCRSVTLTTVSGDVWYDGEVYSDGEYALGTHDGDITFAMPEGAGASISISTFDGAVRPSFPVQFRGGRGRASQFTIGDGSSRVTLEAFDGDIFLIRPGERSPERN